MRRPLTRALLQELRDQGYAAVVARQGGSDGEVYTASKDSYESILECAGCSPFEEADIILLTDDVIDFMPDDYFEGKEVEVD
jgi:hypothetical protein